MSKSGTQTINEVTQEFLNFVKNFKKETIRDKRIKQGEREGEKLDRTPIAITTGAVKPDTLTTALNRIMIASDPEAWDRLHDYDYEAGDEGDSDTGDFEADTDFEGNKQDTKGHYDEPNKKDKPKHSSDKSNIPLGNEEQGENQEKGGKTNE